VQKKKNRKVVSRDNRLHLVSNLRGIDWASQRYGSRTALTGGDIIATMLERNRMRNGRLQRYSAVRTYEIRNLQGKLAAQTVVRVDYEAPD
jgi:hypothetical protein